MGKATARKRVRQDISPVVRPRWEALPPEIVHIIIEMLVPDRETLSACSLAAREFTFSALSCLGRHITVDTVRRLRECASLLNKTSAFQHVRSLDLDVSRQRIIHERDWDQYLTVLEVFASRRTLTRLWLSEAPFYFTDYGRKETVRRIVTSLTATVDELGLYSCHFSCYTEMISLIRAFPLCTSLYVRDCVARKTPGEDAFAGLPQHTLHISDLELTSSSGHRFLIDVSNLIKDAVLDISSLVSFSCDMSTADVARHTTMIVAASPIQRFQLACDEAEAIHILADPVVTRWPLRSLTIGPLTQKDNLWCERAATLNPNLPHLEGISIMGYYKRPVRFPLGFWMRVDRLLSRQDIFPRLERVDICVSVGSRRLVGEENQSIFLYLSLLRHNGKVYFWGEKGALPSGL